MAAPNIAGMTSLKGKTDVQALGTTATAITSNSSSSGLSYKINAITISNITSSDATTSVDINDGSNTYHVIKDVTVPANSTLNLTTRETGFYLQEGESIRLIGSAANTLEAICSYEIIDGPSDSDGSNNNGGNNNNTFFDLSTATFASSFALVTQPEAIFFKPDGTKFYSIEYSNDQTYEWSLSTPWDLSTRTLANTYTDIQSSNWAGFFFKPDGTRVYQGSYNDSLIAQSDISTPWDISTASGSGTETFSHRCPGIWFSSDGTRIFIADDANTVRQYDLGTAWDVTGTVTLNGSFTESSFTGLTDLTMNPTGEQMWLTDRDSGFDNVRQYTLSTPFDVTTAIYDNVSLSTDNYAGDTDKPLDIFFSLSTDQAWIPFQTSNLVIELTNIIST